MSEKEKEAIVEEQQQDISELLQIRRDKLAALQAEGNNPFFVNTCDKDISAQEIHDRFEELEGKDVCIAGRIMSWRDMGKANFIDGTFRGMDGENALVEVGGHTFPIPAPGKMEGVQKDGPCCLAVRPESILLSEEEGPLPGRVSRATYYGAKVEYEVMLGDQPIIVEVYNPQLSKRFAEGEAVHMTLIDRCVRVLA